MAFETAARGGIIGGDCCWMPGKIWTGGAAMRNKDYIANCHVLTRYNWRGYVCTKVRDSRTIGHKLCIVKDWCGG